jgi:hypothetical protein
VVGRACRNHRGGELLTLGQRGEQEEHP